MLVHVSVLFLLVLLVVWDVELGETM